MPARVGSSGIAQYSTPIEEIFGLGYWVEKVCPMESRVPDDAEMSDQFGFDVSDGLPEGDRDHKLRGFRLWRVQSFAAANLA